MKIIKPRVEYHGALSTGFEDTLRYIEISGRTCYKSEGWITNTSSEKFVRGLVRSGHLAMVEHSNHVVKSEPGVIGFEYDDHIIAAIGKYLEFRRLGDVCYIGGSLTAWYKNAVANSFPSYTSEFSRLYGDLFSLPYSATGEGSNEVPFTVCPFEEIPKALHRYSIKFICDRGVSHELVRHRPCSFAQESTRYVNYYGQDMQFIEPAGFSGWDMEAQMEFLNSCYDAEKRYQRIVKPGGSLTPQQARAILPNALKTEIVVTCDIAEWEWILGLRCAPDAHPDFQVVAKMAREALVYDGVIVP